MTRDDVPYRCGSCPVADGLICVSRSYRNEMFCDWAASGDPEGIAWLESESARVDAWSRSQQSPDPPLPSLAAQALSAAGAAVRVAVAAVNGQAVLVPDEVYEGRLRVCRGVPGAGQPSCPNYRAEDDRCGGAQGCGCFLGLKARTATESCPIGKWSRYDQ